MRSSIACARCRRSKVKCVNNGVGTTCRACETTGRECTYPVPSAGPGGSVRRDAIESRQAGENVPQQSDMARKPRPKKMSTPNSVSTRESMRALVDALDPSILTPQVWIELFDIWSLHFATDLPFIHPPTFLQPLRQAGGAPLSNEFGAQRSPTSAFPNASPLVLLAFLALTARFHDKLAAHHSPPSATRPSNPLIACQYYAAACKARLVGNSGDGLGIPEADRVLALAMLALHDWGSCAGHKAWVALGVAIRYSQVLGLQYQPDLDDEPQSRSSVLPHQTPYVGSVVNPDSSHSFVDEETKRRVFWGLFIMDRYLSCGKFRPQMLKAEDMRIQLPSSERSYMFKERVRTGLLSDSAMEIDNRQETHTGQTSSPHRGPNGNFASSAHGNTHRADDERLGRWETGAEEGLVSRHVRAVELYGKIVLWACGGGRRRERHAPWDSASTWNILNVELSNFIGRLPRDMTLSPANIHAHIMSKSSTPFLMMHSVLLLGRMILHRDYIPFIPLRCSRPEGPLDPPMFPPEQYRVPHGFWEYSAAELFSSARSLIDLIQTCHEWNVLPQTPMIGFSVYFAALVGVYAINFPWMDVNGYMCKKNATDAPGEDDAGATASRNALSVIAFMRRRLKMADGWFKTINRVHRYYVRVKKDFLRNVRVLGGPSTAPGPLSIREGGVGGGLEEFRMIEATLRELGTSDDHDVEMTDAHDPEASKADSSVDAASVGVKSEHQLGSDKHVEKSSVRTDQWNAINASSGPIQAGNAQPTSEGSHHGAQSSTTTSPATTTAPYRPSYNGSSQTASVVSPGYSKHQIPPYQAKPAVTGPAIQASVTLQNQIQAPALPPPPTMTAEQTDAWLRSLDTAFAGDDLTAFVEGLDLRPWAEEAGKSLRSGSWLTTVWTGPVPA
ncbi:uncharacterized protein PV09_09343 [Verruconis gallopava]|uniref:Zn(2)-C6 fungal-type domain-containing protein n=1 Tax=Verruconis gallopava TaxID=253628 RepID=A0A0D1ZWN1_9PEZI|nr:uncharacterized protein PV09_09343 [Verruconis gallopava]KIV98897.1 hypothetical protein PV09_09343 [Verruconis gallopava]